MSKDFSDATLTVDGVTVTPTWRWSAQYRAAVVKNIRLTGKTHVSSFDRKRRYIEWYAAKKGLSFKQASDEIG